MSVSDDAILPLDKAIAKLQDYSENVKKRKFVETVEIAIMLGIDPKQSSQMVRGAVALPAGLGREVRIAVFTGVEAKEKEAKAAGAIAAGLEELVAKVEAGNIDFDYCLATPDAMPKISKVAKKLGPRGLMPSLKNGTVTDDVTKAITEAKKGKVSLKSDKNGIIHAAAGKVNFKAADLENNINAILEEVKRLKPESSKGKYLKAIYLSTTMGKSVKIA